MNIKTTHRRAGWIKYILLVALAFGGAAGGIYLSGAWPGTIERPAGQSQILSHRFPLSAYDAKDQIEAPSLAIDQAGIVWLSWASKTAETERTIFLTQSIDAGQSFSVPKTVSKAGVYKTTGKQVGYERRATPHVVAERDKLHLTWSEALPDGSGMRMVLATSADVGATFGSPQVVHKVAGAKPTFTGMGLGADGTITCAWLDDRAGYQQVFAATRPARSNGFNEEQLVHSGQEGQGVCPCCPTDVVVDADGTIYVAFRNIRGGFRDIAVSRKKPGQPEFEEPVVVVPPTWKFDGCPHDGPSLAIAGNNLHLVWMDARSGTPRCYYGRSDLHEMKFESRELHGFDGGAQGNAKLLADAVGGLHVVWEESVGAPIADSGHSHGAPKIGSGGGRAIWYAYRAPASTDFGPAIPVAPKAGIFQTRPTLALGSAGSLFLAWNEWDENGKAVVVARLPGAALYALGGNRP
jgi:hypothetical protein